MTLTLDLPSKLEERLLTEALEQGLSPGEYTLRLLDLHLPTRDRRAELVAILQSWIDAEDAEEQRETGEILVRGLDEDRLSERKLFPRELEGVTW